MEDAFVVSMFVQIDEDFVDHPQGDRFLRSPVVTQDRHELRESAWHSSSGLLASALLVTRCSQ